VDGIATMTEPTDEQLMERFCQGEASACEELFNRHGRRVDALMKSMVRDEALAEDLVQTTFLSVVRSKDRYTPGNPVLPWLFTIATNAARDVLRRKGLKIEELSDTGELPRDIPSGSASTETDPGLRKAVETALNKLPESHREVVVLHKVQGLTFTEIADALGITSAAALIRAHRGYERLRELLAPLGVE
jgi:RNA polymerase sigma-70 factor (ECF subfamily)